MISEVQREYVKQLLLANHRSYPYYIVYSNNNVNGSYSNDDWDLFVIMSPSKITADTLYHYTIPNNSVMYGIRSSNASYNYHSERLSSFSAPNNLTVNNYQFVYSNAEYSCITCQPDILATNYVTQSHFDGFGVALTIILLSVVFFKIVRG